MKRHTETTVRASVYAHRIAEELRKALSGTEDEGEDPTFLLISCNGYFSTTIGEGSLYKTFIHERKIGRFIGANCVAKEIDDPDYNNAKLRIMTFDHAFTHCNTDAQDHKWIESFEIFMTRK